MNPDSIISDENVVKFTLTQTTIQCDQNKIISILILVSNVPASYKESSVHPKNP